MKIKTLKLSEIKENKRNPRKISPNNEAVLRHSLDLFGQVETLIVDKDNNLIGGHQRLRQLKDLDETEALVSVYDGDQAEALGIVVNHGNFEGDFEIGEFTDMVGNMVDLEEFKGLEFTKTIRSGNVVLVGQEQVTFGGWRAQINSQEVFEAEQILGQVPENKRAYLIQELMEQWLKDL